MRYSSFEMLVLSVGGGAIVASVLFSLGQPTPPVLTEMVAQALLLAVLLGAVHWGRRGGLWSAIVASSAYVILRIPLVVAAQGVTWDIAVLLVIRIATFGVVGVLGGEMSARIKYVLVRLASDTSIDEWTRVYNQTQMARILETAHGQHVRYGAPYAVIVVSISPAMFADLRPSKQRSILRSVADHLRHDVRLVDEIGRLDDGRFLVVLPHTPRDGALVAAERVRADVRDVLGARDETVAARVYGAPEDIANLDALLASVGQRTPGQTESSGSWSFSASTSENPTLSSAPRAAEGSSTRKT